MVEMLGLEEIGTSLDQNKMIDDDLRKGPLLAPNARSTRQGSETATKVREGMLEGTQEFLECPHLAPHQTSRLLKWFWQMTQPRE